MSGTEYTGGSVTYYQVSIANPTTSRAPYIAECNDIIEALDMNYAEGNAFKAIWRRAAARTLGKAKKGYTDGLYDAEKVEFFGQRLVLQEKAARLGIDATSQAADADGWIKWGGGECPVAAGTAVDVRYRNGEVAMNVPAVQRRWFGSRCAESWGRIGGHGGEIIAYRISKEASHG